MSILIKNGYIVTVDEGKIYRDGAIAIEDDRIVAVGPTDEVTRKYRGEHVLDARGHIVLPGFVNAHNHSDGDALSRGYGLDALAALDYFIQFKWPRLIGMTEKDYYLGSLLCYTEMVRTGTTFMADNYYAPKGVNSDGVPKAAEEVGIRSVLVRGYHDHQMFMPAEFMERGDELVKEYESLYQRWDNKAEGRIRVWIGPVNLLYNTPESITKLHEVAQKHNSGLHSHVAEDKKGTQLIKERFGKGYLEVFSELGVMDNKFQAAHSIYLNDREMELLKIHGSTAVHNPAGNMMNSAGIAPVVKMRKMGVRVALGSDTKMDMMAAMKFAACLHKIANMDPTALKASDAVEMATIEGARAYGVDDQLGSLKIGKKADVVTLNLRKPYSMPVKDPIQNMVYFLNGGDVENVIIDGKIIVDHGKVVTVDEEQVMSRAQEAFENLTARMSKI
jgi:5-methylthioadenosine/S-adenosylhomocysteine deaminase